MKFSGQIEDFPVTDIMQYLHTSEKSGTLYLKKDEELGRVHFDDGRIIRVGLPGMTNLGDVLLEKGRISQNDLRSAIRIQQVQSEPRPLGMILEEMGAITHEVLKDAVIRQIEEVLCELVNWEEGAFSFELENNQRHDDISIAPDDLFPPEEIDTKILLIEAMQLFEQSKKNGNGNDDYPEDFLSPLPSETSIRDYGTTDGADEDSDLSMMENYEQCLSLLKTMLSEGRKKDKTQSISVCFLRILSEHLDRAILFLVRRGELLGLGAFGRTQSRHPLDNEIKNLRLPLEGESLLEKSITSKSPFYGEPVKETWLSALHERIGPPSRPEVMILPVAGIERVICLVYGDNGRVARPISRSELLEIAAGQAGMIFENTVLRKQVQRKTH